MTRLRLWLVMLPLLAAGTQGAASVVDTFAPPSYEGVELFSRSNASYSLVPLVAALGAAVLLGAAWSVATSVPAVRRLPMWGFACLPPLVFVVQEHVEYVLAHGHLPWTLSSSPIFIAGLLLQMPFAAAAYLVARLLLGVAVAIAELAAERRRAPQRRAPICVRPGGDLPRRLGFRGGGRLTRGPPDPIAR
jgi:hypothetical protein